MQLPRFRLSALLAVIAIAAVWFAMLSSVSPFAEDVLRGMQLMAPIAALVLRFTATAKPGRFG